MKERLMVQVCIHRILSKNGEKFEVEFMYNFDTGQMPLPVSKLNDVFNLPYEAARFARKAYGAKDSGMVYYNYKTKEYTTDWSTDGTMFYRFFGGNSQLDSVLSAVNCARNNLDLQGKVKVIWTGDVGCVPMSFIKNEDAIK